jgi:hypothetical protein
MGRRGRIKAFAAALLALQIGFAVNGYRDPHAFFAFQPFRESSTWRAEIVRVTWDGERRSIADGWAGYEWNELVDVPMLSNPFGPAERHASYGIGATLDFLDDALDWVADHTPADVDTRYLEATVTYHRNGRGPYVEVVRSHDREPP